MKIIKAHAGQTIEDIALQEYGCLEGVFQVMADNGLNLDSKLIPGQELQILDEIPELTANNRAIARRIASEGINPNRGAEPGVEVGYVEPGYVTIGYVIS